jgi:hypothetical protein
MSTDERAFAFLASEFAGDIYVGWPIERRLEAYLRHQGLSKIADAGEPFEALLDRVMANFGRAPSKGVLADLTND